MAAVLAYIRVIAGDRTEPYFVMTVRPDEVMGWQAHMSITHHYAVGVRALLKQYSHPYQTHDAENGRSQISAQLGSIPPDNILGKLEGLTPRLDRRHPELFYHAQEPANETTETVMTLTVNTDNNTVTARQCLAPSIEPWPANVWRRLAAALSGPVGFGSDLISVKGGADSVVISLTWSGMHQLNAYGLTIVDTATSVIPS